MAAINIGIVGTGRVVNAHLRGYQLLRECGVDTFRITALCSRRAEDAAAHRRRGEGPEPRPPASPNPADPLGAPHLYVDDFQPELAPEVYRDVGDLLASAEVDAIDCPASVFAHHTVGLAALEAGKHLLVQKPLAITVEAGRRLVELAEANGLTLGVFENARHGEGARVARWLLDAGYLGQVQMVSACGLGSADWSPDRIVAGTPWRHRKLLAGAGASLDLGVHLFHRLRYLCGEIVEVGGLAETFERTRYTFDAAGAIAETVECDVDDAFFATCRFANDAVGQLSASWAGHGGPTPAPEGLTIYGTSGCLRGTSLCRDDGEVWTGEELLEDEAPQATRDAFFPLGLRDTFALTILDFLRAVEAGRDPEASGDEGLRDLATAYAVVESAALRQPVRVADVLEGRARTYQREIDDFYGL